MSSVHEVINYVNELLAKLSKAHDVTRVQEFVDGLIGELMEVKKMLVNIRDSGDVLSVSSAIDILTKLRAIISDAIALIREVEEGRASKADLRICKVALADLYEQVERLIKRVGEIREVLSRPTEKQLRYLARLIREARMKGFEIEEIDPDRLTRADVSALIRKYEALLKKSEPFL